MKNRKYNWLILALVVLLGTGLSFTPSSGGQDHGDFPDIYIDESVAPGGVGSLLDPYSDFSEINWTTGGDNSVFDAVAANEDVTINLQMGEEWRETLTIGTDGSAAHSITIQSYGSGAKPIINGADIITGWTNVLGAGASIWTAFEQTGDTQTDKQGGTSNCRNIIEAASISTTVIEARFKMVGHSGGTTDMEGSSFGLRDGSSFSYDGAPTRVTWDTDQSDFEIGASAEKWSDWMTITIDSTKDHLWHIYDSDGTVNFTGRDQTDINGFKSGADYTLTESYVGYSNNSWMSLEEIEGRAATDVWQATVNTEPNQVFADGTRLTHNDGATTGVGADEWDWDANTLYINIEEDPDGNTIEASQRSQCFLNNNTDYINVDGITVKNSNQYGLQNQRGNNMNFTNITATYNIDAGILTQGIDGDENSYVLIEDTTASYNIGNGVEVSSYSHYTTIRRVTANNNGTDAATYASAAGIYLAKNPAHAGSTWTNNIVENCTSHTNGVETAGESAGSGIRYDECHNGGGHYIRYNLTYGNEGPGIWVENETGNMIVSYNISHSNISSQSVDSGIGIRAGIDNQGLKVYNNVMYGNRINLFTGAYSGLSGDVTFDDNEFKNNIMFGATSIELSAVYGGDNGANGSGNVYTYNCLGPESADFVEWGGASPDTYDEWETAYGATTSSIEADPLMTDPANDDFILQATSPCVDAGTDVSLTEDYNSVSVPLRGDMGTNKAFISVGGNLYIIPGDATEGSPDIGAYEYIAPYKIKDGHLYLRLSEKFYLQIMQPGVNQWLN